MGLAVVIISNLFLVLVNSSESDFAYRSVGLLAKDKVMWIVACGTFLMLLSIIYTPLNGFLKLAPLTAVQFFVSLGIAFAAVMWYEIVKLVRHIKKA
jgi:Ca2+-transporting ATPase